MILAGILAVAAFPGRFVEETVPSAKSTLIEAAVVFPFLSPDDRAAEEIIAASLLEGTADYTKSQIRDYTVMAGEPLRCVATPDCLRITLGLGRSDWKMGLRILKSLLTSADLSQESIDKAKATLPFINRNPWRLALDPTVLDYGKVRRRDIRDFVDRNIIPEATSIVISGSFNPGEPRDFWMEEAASWQSVKLLQFKPDRRPDHAVRLPDSSVSILRWNGPEIEPKAARLAVPLLAAFALGVGKDSAVFRVLREKERLSYRQEATLTPYGQGFRLQLVSAFRPRDDEASLAEKVKADMLADIERWDESTKGRAFHMAESALLHHAFAVPLGITREGILGADDFHFLAAYWPMKTGAPWNTREMLRSMQAVTLGDLKAVSKDIFERGVPVQTQ